MSDRPSDAAWRKLGAEPGLCEACRHAKLNETRRGTAYLRCLRAAWDSTLSRYPRLLRQLRGTVIPEPRRDRAHRDSWSLWRRRHQYRARQAHLSWQAYADALPE